jgi:glycosyltransferase involved in cell wall biosynthesis
MKIAILSADDRESFRKYDLKSPIIPVPQKALLSAFADTPHLEVHYVSCAQVRMESPSLLASNIFFHSLYVPKIGWLRSGYAGCIAAVRRKLRDIQPDLVHAQGTERDCAMSALAFSGPKVLTIHGNIRRVALVLKAAPFSYWWLQARLENLVISKFDGVICLSHHARTQVARRARTTWIVPNPVDPAFLEIQLAPTLPARILCLATISPLKNQLGLISVLERYPFQYPFELYFFGGLDRASNYGRDFLQAVSRNPHFFYGGLLDRSGLQNELSKAYALILPTFEENCPLVVLEAQAAGVPVIASNVGGVPDLIQDGVTGLLTDPAQPETMPRALQRLLENPRLSKSLAAEGRKQALARFHPRVIAEKHIEIYREVIASK